MPISVYGEANPDLARFLVERTATLWRYMDIGKYLDVLTSNRIWFTRAIEFRKTDPYEGGLTRYDDNKTAEIPSVRSKEELKPILRKFHEHHLAEMVDELPDKSVYFFQLLFIVRIPHVEMNSYTNSVSCWHQNQDESDAMWALYAHRDAGVAIRTTVGRVLQAFAASKRSIFLAKVNYDSANNLTALTSGIFGSLLIKRHAFHHENEVRIIALTPDGYEAPEWSEDNQRYNIDVAKQVSPGVYIECDIDALIEEVVVSPLMPMHTYQAIEEITKRLRPTTTVRKSNLLTKELLPYPISSELAMMWEHFLRTRLVLDFNEISS
jgi:hypothetical protein